MITDNQLAEVSRTRLAAQIDKRTAGKAMLDTAIEGLSFYRQNEAASSCSLCGPVCRTYHMVHLDFWRKTKLLVDMFCAVPTPSRLK